MKLRTSGRGRGYSAWRGLLESALAVAYVGDWPARLWSLAASVEALAVTRHVLTLPAAPGPSCCVALVSDLHVGPTTPVELLERAFEAVRDERPDVLMLGGDYVFLDAEPHRLAVLGTLVRSIECPVKLAVLGNHDLWTFDPWTGRCDAQAYPAGLDRFDSGTVYVSRGVGGVEVPIRILAPPDILVLDLIRPRNRQHLPPAPGELRGST